MSRRTNRLQISPVKIKPNTEQRKSNYNSEIQRIINHAAKLISQYNKNELEKLMVENLDNQTKIGKLLKESKEKLPKISWQKKSEKPRKRKRAISNAQIQNFEVESESEKADHDFNYNSLDEFEQCNMTKTSKSSSHEISVQISLLRSNKSDDLDQESSLKKSKENSETDRSSENFGILTELTFEKSNCSICSTKEQEKSNDEENNVKDLTFVYEIEIKTADKDNSDKNINVFIQLYGETSSMDKSICLNQIKPKQINSNLFQPGNLDKFSIVLHKFVGSIINVKIGLENDGSLWNLDYLCVRDCQSKKDYFFSCRRCLGIDSPDKLTQITLGYTPPYKMLKPASLSKSNTDNIETENLEESIIEFGKNDVQSPKSNNSQFSWIRELNHKSDQKLQKNKNHKNSSGNEYSTDKMNGKLNEKRPSRPISLNSVYSNINSTSETRSSSSSSSHGKISSSSHHKDEIVSQLPFKSNEDIFIAIKAHDFEAVKRLCESSSKRIDPDENGCSPIHVIGIYYQNKEECKKIIKHLTNLDVDINCKSFDGSTSLHYAVINNNLPAVRFMIEHCGADPDIADQNGYNTIQLARKYNFVEIVEYFTNLNEKKSIKIENDLQILKRNDTPKENDIIQQNSEKNPFKTDNNDNKDLLMTQSVIHDTRNREDYNKEKEDNSVNDVDKENVETDEDNSGISENNYKSRKASLSIDSKDSRKFPHNLAATSVNLTNEIAESENAEKSQPINTDQNISIVTPDKESLENLENKQFEAENKGIMFYKEFPDTYQKKSSNSNIKIQNKSEEFTDELSTISSHSNTSSVSTCVPNMSPITSRSNSSNSLSDYNETIRPKYPDISKTDNNHDLNVIVNDKIVENDLKNEENEGPIENTMLDSLIKSEENLIKKHQDYSISNGKFSPTPQSN